MPKPSSIKYQVSNTGDPKVAIVTDWMYGGGSEKVVEQFHKLYPDAPIYTSYCSNDWRNRLDNKVITGYLQHAPFRQLRKFLPLLRQWWFARLDLSGFDLVISITGNGEAKFARATHGRHISYCHTPVHYYWRHYEEYLKNPGFRPKWLIRLGLKLLVRPLRKRDFQAAQRVDRFIANSSHISRDIQKFYGRNSHVIFPPVDTARFAKAALPVSKRTGFAVWGRHVPMKKIDLAIRACNDLKLPLTVASTGPETVHLKSIAGSTITFAGHLSDEEMTHLAGSATGFIFPSFEDFGIAPIEAMAAGTPVIAFKAGGALDYVIPGKTGEFFDKQTVASLTKVLKKFNIHAYKPTTIQEKAQEFSVAQFHSSIKDFIET